MFVVYYFCFSWSPVPSLPVVGPKVCRYPAFEAEVSANPKLSMFILQGMVSQSVAACRMSIGVSLTDLPWFNMALLAAAFCAGLAAKQRSIASIPFVILCSRGRRVRRNAVYVVAVNVLPTRTCAP